MNRPPSERNDALAVHLESRVNGRAPSKQMTFDPTTGELRLVPRGSAGEATRDPDAVVVDQIAESGFFAKPTASAATRGIVTTSAAAGGGTAGAGVGAAIGMAVAGPPGAGIGFLIGIAAGTAGGAAAGQRLGQYVSDEDEEQSR